MHDLDRLLQQAAADGRQAARPLSAGDVRGIGATMRRVRSLAGTSVAALTLAGAVLLATTVSAPDATLPARPETSLPGPTSPVPTSTEEDSPPPATSPTPPPPTPSPTQPTTSSPPPAEPILAGNLLGAEDLEPVIGIGGTRTWVESALPPLPRCTPELAETAMETGEVSFVLTDSVNILVQRAEAYDSADDAAARLADLRAAIGRCAEESDDVDMLYAFTLTGVGDAGFIVDSREPEDGVVLDPSVDPYGDVQLHATTRFAQTGRVVTWTVQTVLKGEYLNYPEVGDLGTAVDQLCEPADGSCRGDAGLTITFPTERAGTEVPPGGHTGDGVTEPAPPVSTGG